MEEQDSNQQQPLDHKTIACQIVYSQLVYSQLVYSQLVYSQLVYALLYSQLVYKYYLMVNSSTAQNPFTTYFGN